MRTRWRSARSLGLWVLASWAALIGAFCSARAQDEVERAESELVIPPAPTQAPPRLAVEVHVGFAAPLDNGSLCPSGVGCVLRSGGGIGASIERRYPSGLGFLGGYDIWFLDSDSVYELGVQQALHAGLRFTMPTDIVFHPLFEVTGGLMGYGDTFRIATIGGLIQAFAGAEIELTDTLGLRFGFGLRGFSHTGFRTQRDQVERGNHGLFSEAVFVEAGLTVM